MKYKIFKISHYRCAEWDNDTFIFGPEDKTLKQFQEDAEAAEREYLSVIDNYNENYKDMGYTKFSITDFPDNLTIAECKKINQEITDKKEKMNKLKREATGDFSQ